MPATVVVAFDRDDTGGEIAVADDLPQRAGRARVAAVEFRTEHMQLLGPRLVVACRPGPAQPLLHRGPTSSRPVPDLHVVEVTIDPGGTLGWHSHPGPRFLIVTRGTATN